MGEPAVEKLPYSIKKDTILLRIKAFPKSERNRISGVRNGELIVRVQAPAQKDQANKELVKFLSKALGVARSEIGVLSGETSRHKVVALPLTAKSALEEAL
jgi:uncharacterized protein (TIGR00251 family)